MTPITVISVVLASMASLIVCLTAARNFLKGWRDKIIEDEKQHDDIIQLKKRIAELEKKSRDRLFDRSFRQFGSVISRMVPTFYLVE
jgi:hypothetical protein